MENRHPITNLEAPPSSPKNLRSQAAETDDASRGPNPLLPKSTGSLIRKTATISISVATIVFLGFALHKSWSGFSAIAFTPRACVTVGLLAICYAATFGFLFLSWSHSVQKAERVEIPLSRVAYVYFLSNIAKYLPGNVLHLAGRQILGKRAGWSHRAIAQATFLEIVALAASGTAIVLLFLVLAPSLFIDSVHQTYPISLRTVQLASTALLVVAIAVSFLGWPLGIYRRLFNATPGTVAFAFSLCTLFFICNAGMAAAMTVPFAPEHPAIPVATTGVFYISAWLIGFVVPGAPGGLGVRESVFVMLMGGAGEESAATALGLAFGLRFASSLGDILCVIAALYVPRILNIGTAATHDEAAGG
jgi:hypothetical protein